MDKSDWSRVNIPFFLPGYKKHTRCKRVVRCLEGLHDVILGMRFSRSGRVETTRELSWDTDKVLASIALSEIDQSLVRSPPRDCLVTGLVSQQPAEK